MQSLSIECELGDCAEQGADWRQRETELEELCFLQEGKHVMDRTSQNRSQSVKELATALARAQGQIKSALKDSVNPLFRSKYADLAQTWDACREALSANNIAVIQFPIHSDDGRLHMETTLAHASGEWISREFSLPVAKQDAHGYGSAITYARRFCLAAAVGIVADEDDDGNAATARGRTEQQQPASSAETPGELYKTLEAAARRGMDALRGAYAELPEEQRASVLKSDLAVLKRVASESDAANDAAPQAA